MNTAQYKVRLARASIDMTLKDFAKKCGLSLSLVSNIENNRTAITAKTAHKIEQALGLPKGCILNDKQAMVQWNV